MDEELADRALRFAFRFSLAAFFLLFSSDLRARERQESARAATPTPSHYHNYTRSSNPSLHDLDKEIHQYVVVSRSSRSGHKIQ